MEGQAMKFSVARLYKFNGDGNLKAFADLMINDAIIVKGVRVVSGKNGLFVSMPRQRSKDGKWYEAVRPLDTEVRDEIAARVLEAYEEAPDEIPIVMDE